MHSRHVSICGGHRLTSAEVDHPEIARRHPDHADIQIQSFVSGLDAMRDDANTGRRCMEMFPDPF